jgi:hypothetical protein
VLDFSITEVVREAPGPDGWLYQTRSRLDFHDGWYTTIRRTKRAATGFPMWTHGVFTESLTATFEWASQAHARPVMKFADSDTAERWLDQHLRVLAHG